MFLLLAFFSLIVIFLLFLKRRYVDASQVEIPIPPIAHHENVKPLPKDNKTCLVTGGGGSVGRRLVELIIQRNLYNKVKILDVSKTWDPQDNRVEYIVGNICKSSDVNQAVSDCGTVFHLASIIDLRNGTFHKAKMHNINVVGTYNIINACITKGTRNLVYLSTMGHPRGTKNSPATEETTDYINSPDFSIYLSTKWKAEAAVLAANGHGSLRTCALRCNIIWGLRDRFNYSLFIKSSYYYLYGDPVHEYKEQPSTFLDSICDALLAAGNKLVTNPDVVSGKFYYVTDVGSLRMCELSRKITEKLSLKISRFMLTGILRKSLIFFSSFVDWLTGGQKNWALLQFTECALKFTFVEFYVSSEKAQRDLGYVPLTVDEGLERLKILHENLLKEEGKTKKE